MSRYKICIPDRSMNMRTRIGLSVCHRGYSYCVIEVDSLAVSGAQFHW